MFFDKRVTVRGIALLEVAGILTIFSTLGFLGFAVLDLCSFRSLIAVSVDEVSGAIRRSPIEMDWRSNRIRLNETEAKEITDLAADQAQAKISSAMNEGNAHDRYAVLAEIRLIEFDTRSGDALRIRATPVESKRGDHRLLDFDSVNLSFEELLNGQTPHPLSMPATLRHGADERYVELRPILGLFIFAEPPRGPATFLFTRLSKVLIQAARVTALHGGLR